MHNTGMLQLTNTDVLTHRDQGATPREQILEAARRNNTDLLHTLLASQTGTSELSRESAIADLINNSISPTGLTPLHLAASTASYEVLDILLDQELVETDPLTRRDQRTPLHLAVVHVNEEMGPEVWDKAGALAHVEILLDAGCDLRIRDKAKLRPVDVVDPRCEVLRQLLRRAEMQATAGGDIVADEDEGGSGPPSDSE